MKTKIKATSLDFIKLGVLGLSLVLSSYQVASAAPKKKPVLLDDEFNDPLLELQAQEEVEQKAMEEEALEAREGTPLEENKLPEPPPMNASEDVLSLADQEPETEQKKVKNSEPSSLVKKSKPAKGNEQSSVEVSAPDNSLVDAPLVDPNPSDSNQLIESLNQQQEEEQKTAVLPRWNPRDPSKGFESADDDGSYYYDENAPDSERFYDDNLKIVPRPENYKRGLLSVSGDGSYMYAGEDSELEGSASVRVAQMSPIPFENEAGFTYADFYGENAVPVVLIDYDWLALRRFGQWVISIGTGIGMAGGAGRFLDTGDEAREKYTLYIVLNHISFLYRMQYSTHPWIVPYFSGGGVPAILYEHRDDNKGNRYEFVPAVQATGGVRFNIGKFDSSGVANLDAEYGINNLWLDAEVRRIQSFNERIDISNNLINVGLGFDF